MRQAIRGDEGGNQGVMTSDLGGLPTAVRDRILHARRAVAATLCFAPLTGKGLGVLAARAVEEGERIIEEAPLLTLTPDGEGRYDGKYASEMEREEARSLLATLCVAGVGTADGAGARAGARVGAGEDGTEARRAHDDASHLGRAHDDASHLGRVIEANAIVIEPSAEPGREIRFSVVCLMISRLNHKCSPSCNAEFRWNTRLGKGTVYALRPIAPGEEICFDYGVGKLRSRADRQKVLREKFGFECCCERCREECDEERGLGW